MSSNPQGERPEPAKPSPGTHTPGQGEAPRYPVPHAPVKPQFAGPQDDRPDTPARHPAPKSPRRRARSRGRGCVLPLLGIGVIVASLVALALFLPPFSLWEEIDSALNDDESGADGATITDTGLVALNGRLEADGLTIEAASGATPFSVRVVSMAPAEYLMGTTPRDGWHCATDLPAHHALISPVYSLTQQGAPPDAFTLSVAISEDALASGSQLEMYLWNADVEAWEFLPWKFGDTRGILIANLSYLPRCVAVFRGAESMRQVGVSLGLADTFDPALAAANARVYPGSLRPTSTGALQVVLAPGFQTGQGYDVLPLIQNFSDPAVIDVATVQTILQSAGLREQHARQIAAFALGAEGGYAGVGIDYRAIPPDLRSAYAGFLHTLADLLHSQGRTLTVMLPAPVYDAAANAWDTGGYDWPIIGHAADAVVIRMPLDPAAYAPGGAADQVVAWAVTQVRRDALQLGLDAFSVEDQDGGLFVPIALDDALWFLGTMRLDPPDAAEAGSTITARLANPYGLHAEIGRDGAPYVRYLNSKEEPLRTMWITDAAALYDRVARAANANLGGVYVAHLLDSGTAPGLADALLAYRLDQPNQAAALDLSVTWTFRAGDAILDTTTAAPDQPVTVELPDGIDTLTVEAEIAGLSLGSQTIRVMAPATPTPTEPPATPEPSATIPPTDTAAASATATGAPTATTAPEITPTGTPASGGLPGETIDLPTLAPAGSAETPAAVPAVTDIPPATGTAIPAETVEVAVVPTATEPPAATPAPPIPTVDPAVLAGADVGRTFEAGAHLARLSRSLLRVGQTYLTWIKLDVPYLLGSDPADWKNTISEAQANGFKVLLSVAGNPEQLAATDQGEYFRAYAAFVGGLAGQGADGIEVWREMNTASAWPAGSIDPNAYVELLGLSYNAIKTARPDTLVISGALKPRETTPEEERSIFGWDDDAYYADLAGAGAAQYADCIGVEYLEGAVAPDAASGDPRGDSPVYYLPSVTARAVDAFGESRPVCYTRVGYLAPPGPLPEGYEWAQSITTAQQAAWLAALVQANLGSERVRLLILWTMDSPGEGSPDAGYALIRPDESCPACDAVAPLLEPAP